MPVCAASAIVVKDLALPAVERRSFMTDLELPESVGPPLGGQPDKVTRSAHTYTVLRLALVLIGLAGGAIGFWGFFVNFFHQPNTGLYSSGTVWFDLIPIFIGIGAIGLAMPGGLKSLYLRATAPIHGHRIRHSWGLCRLHAPRFPRAFMGLRVLHDLGWIWRLDPRLIVSGGAVASRRFETVAMSLRG